MAKEPKTAEWYEQQLANYRGELDELNPQLDQAKATIRGLETQVQQALSAADQVGTVNKVQAAQIDELMGQVAALQEKLAWEEAANKANKKNHDESAAALQRQLANARQLAQRRLAGLNACLKAGAHFAETAARELAKEAE